MLHYLLIILRDLEKISFRQFIKITLTEQVKILEDKTKVNKAQYDFDREAGKTSALSCGELEKYEYLTGEDLGYKPDVIQKAKYSPLGKVFHKRLDKCDKKEVLLKNLKNIEGKNEQQLNNQLELVKYNVERKSLNKLTFLTNMSQNAKEKYTEIKKIDSEINYNKLVCVHANGKVYNFNL